MKLRAACRCLYSRWMRLGRGLRSFLVCAASGIACFGLSGFGQSLPEPWSKILMAPGVVWAYCVGSWLLRRYGILGITGERDYYDEDDAP